MAGEQWSSRLGVIIAVAGSAVGFGNFLHFPGQAAGLSEGNPTGGGTMTPGGWTVMILSVGIVTGVFVWCLWKVLATPDESEKLHGFSFETPDEKADS